ncbi:MAG: WYL domain-containing protein [Pseudomonadota bacterium]
MSGDFETLRSAIENRQQVLCYYKDHDRELCPHTLGYKDGREKVLGFQFGGGSSKGLPDGGEWRCMFVDDIQNLEVRDGDWHTSDNHSQPQTCVDDVVAEAFG